jgi:hypothetical protein
MSYRNRPLRQLHEEVGLKLGERADWLRIYVVNEEELLLGGTCPTPAARQRVAAAIRSVAPGVRVRNAVGIGPATENL